MLWPTAERMTFAASSALHLRYVAEVTGESPGRAATSAVESTFRRRLNSPSRNVANARSTSTASPRGRRGTRRTRAEVTFGFCVSDHGLDGEAAAQLSPNDTEDAALLPEMKTRR